ncbi:hypothetical protein [Enterobacter hormaechei]|uniref:hypothetical protein n=1 Tax=Enterobacter hormaechei TaxID=158836 RepID=UPI0005EDB875|nr:hypothetical protein [Enterobacter hormaechei]KJL71782.1 hypothetical protein SS35_21920 [Enterobacter hormaechei subsp. steigerwaltii]KJL91663.1 hypothetical protein SS61_05000 [Enterobacter hormaechei subsp. steigerwaltii]KJX47739.1 hypothetical protein SG73_21175 [Enterobacter hormaechei subsp. steigerwaltii]
MSVKSIKLDREISDPEFVAISASARKGERAHLLGMLRIRMAQLKKESATSKEIFSSVEQWICNREITTSEDKNQ